MRLVTHTIVNDQIDALTENATCNGPLLAW